MTLMVREVPGRAADETGFVTPPACAGGSMTGSYRGGLWADPSPPALCRRKGD